jgi:uncharacterized protein involved in cysteine biosynthesis
MPRSLFHGALFLVRGFQLLTRPGLRRYVAVPLAVNLLVFGLGIWAGAAGFDVLMDRLRASIPGWLAWLEWLLWPLFVLALLIVVFYTFTLVANLLAAPFNGLLAEQAERIITGRDTQDATDWGRLLRELPGTLADELRKVLYSLLWSIPFLLLALFVPLIGPLLWFLFSAWVLALQYVDFPMGNHGLKFRQMRTSLWRRLPLGLSFGGAVSLATAIPVVNFAVMPAAVAGATLMWCKELQEALQLATGALTYLGIVLADAAGEDDGIDPPSSAPVGADVFLQPMAGDADGQFGVLVALLGKRWTSRMSLTPQRPSRPLWRLSRSSRVSLSNPRWRHR